MRENLFVQKCITVVGDECLVRICDSQVRVLFVHEDLALFIDGEFYLY
jgi:hypothetical protein